MALTINTNMQSLVAQKNLRRTESPLAQAMQRLSSGRRINSSKDDAAGLAIATRQSRQIRGLGVAMRNANDGISFAQTAEGAMNEMISGLQRINELANQGASNNTSADRNSMNEEVQELVAEMNRIVTQTRYNGDTFLNKAQSIDIQVGVEVKETINIATANISPDTMGVATNFSNTLSGSDIAVSAMRSYLSSGLSDSAALNGIDLGGAASTASEFQNNSINLINKINSTTGDTGVTAFGFGNALVSGGSANGVVVTNTAAFTVGAGYLNVNGVQLGSFSLGTNASAATAAIMSAVNAKSSTMGVSAQTVDASTGSFVQGTAVTANSVIVLTNTTGAAISVSTNSGVSGGNYFTSHAFASTSMSVSAGQNGKIIFNDSFDKSTATFGGTDVGAAFGVTEGVSSGSATSSVSLTATSINSVSVGTAADANITILAAKQALDTLTGQQATLGAKLNRLDSTIRNIEDTKENITAARSRILDADFAQETAKMTKSLILQQAGTSILAQANQLPNNVLSLLQ